MLQMHKEAILLCEEKMTRTEAQSALSAPQMSKSITTQTKPRKISKHCTNCGRNNHNVETCKVKKEEPTIAVAKATNQPQKGQKNILYASFIYGLNGHKMMDCPKFANMQKMFQRKNASNSEGKAIVEVETINANVNSIDVNVTTRSRIIEK
jgi:hypothetical protein